MTLKEYQEACFILEIKDKCYESLRKLDSIIDRLKCLGDHGASSIHIKLNDEYVYTPEASIDYSDLLGFLINQRNKLEEKLKMLKRSLQNYEKSK